MAEAALLGVAHQVADAIDAVRGGIGAPLRTIRVDGGMSRNDSLLQAIADLTGTVLERPAATEVTALGAGRAGRPRDRAVGSGRAGAACRSRPAGRIRPALPEDARRRGPAGLADGAGPVAG